MSARRMAQAIRDGAAQTTSQGPGPRLGTVTRVAPLRIDVHASDLELDDDDVVIGAAGLSKGDVVVLVEVDDGEWAILNADVLANAASDLKVIREGPLNLADRRFGLVNGGSVDAPLAAAKALLPLDGLGVIRGGDILVPAGDYTSAALPSFDDTRNVTIRGEGGQNGGAQGTTRIISSSAASRILSPRSTTRFRLKNLQLLYSNAAFAGDLIDFGWSAAALDSSSMEIEGCYLGGSGVSGAASLLRLVKAISGEFAHNTFGHAQRHVRGLGSGADYSNVMNFRRNTFVSHVLDSVAAAGEGWKFDTCDWAAKQSGAAGAFLQDQGLSEGLTFENCWFGDVNALGYWISVAGHGLVFEGNHVGGGTYGVLIGNGCKGNVVNGNYFDTVVNAIQLGAACTGDFAPNFFTGCTNQLVDGGTLAAHTHGIVQPNADSDFELRGRWKAPQGLHIMTKAGVPTDADFPTDRPPQSGLLGCIDTTNSRLYIRVGATWKFAALT